MNSNATPIRPAKPSLKWLGIALALVVLGGLGAHLVQTVGHTVRVTGFKLPTENGQWVTADLFKPDSATDQTPAPAVVICPGFERSKETMSGWSIELARRGIVVITIDPYNQGASSSTMQKRSASTEGYGVIPMVEFICNTTNLNYVDKTRLGAAGYSAGGNAVLQSASRFGARQAKALRQAERKDSDQGRTVTEAESAAAKAENKLAAIFIGGYVLTLTNKTLDTLNANACVDYGCYDEGAFRNQKGSADLRTAAESLLFVNSVLPEDQRISTVEIDKVYGSVANRTLRLVHNPPGIHPVLPYQPRHVTDLVGFFTLAFGLKPTLPATDQIWFWKDLFTGIALVGGLLFLVPFTALLLTLPVFQSLVHPVPVPLPAPARKGKIIFWSTFTFSALLACFLFIPLARETELVFPESFAGNQTWFFPQRINNAILLWAVANGLIGLFLFALNYRLFGKRNGVTPEMWGVQTSVGELAKTLLLAVIVFAAFYGLVFLSYGIFHTDFRAIFVSAPAAFPPKMLLVALEYWPLFFIFYLANSLRVNGAGRFTGQREWVSQLIAGLGNSVGLLLILGIQYAHLIATGTVYWTQEWLYANLLFGVTPMMFLLPILNRRFFYLTGRVYLGAMITCLVFILMMLTSNVCYIPLK